MDIAGTVVEIFHFFELTLPFIFLGFFIANLIKTSRYFDLIGIPMSGIARAANLPAECSTAFSMYLFNSWSGAGMLAEYYKARILAERQVIVSVVIAHFPGSINSLILFLGPLALSVFGFRTGLSLLAIELLMALMLVTAGVCAGRMTLIPGSAGDGAQDRPATGPSRPGADRWKDTLIKCLKKSISDFTKTALVLVPTGTVIIVLLNMGIQEYSTALMSPFLWYFHLPPASIAVFAASLVSQVAAITATGTIITKEGLPVLQCLFIYALSRSLHLGTGSIRSGLPTNVALFGHSLGLKVTLIDFAMVQGTAAIIIASLFVLQGMWQGCASRSYG